MSDSLSHARFGLPPRSEFIQECECPVPFDMLIDDPSHCWASEGQ